MNKDWLVFIFNYAPTMMQRKCPPKKYEKAELAGGGQLC